MAGPKRPTRGSAGSPAPQPPAKPAKPPSPRTRAGKPAKPGGVATPATVRTEQAKERVIRATILNRQQAFNYANQVGADRVVSVLRRAMADLELRLATVPRSLIVEGAFTPTAMRATMHQIEDLIAELVVPGVRGAVIDSKRVAAALGKVDGLRNLVEMDTRFAGIVSTARLGIASQLDPFGKGPNASVLRRLATEYPKEAPGKGIMERYGMEVIGKFEERLMVATISGKPWTEVREDLISESQWLEESPMFWAQRIVRTESMGAYNRSILENGEEANEVVGGDMVKILVAGFDDRTGWDSYQVHGQIRRLDEPFEWVTKNGDTIAYMTPPNRPNDREVVVFHRMAWPIPDELKPVSDSEYEARFAEQNKKGSPPERPKMSTVPLSAFGTG